MGKAVMGRLDVEAVGFNELHCGGSPCGVTSFKLAFMDLRSDHASDDSMATKIAIDRLTEMAAPHDPIMSTVPRSTRTVTRRPHGPPMIAEVGWSAPRTSHNLELAFARGMYYLDLASVVTEKSNSDENLQ
jgi:hypothetical protein